MVNALYECRITHARAAPIRHAFGYSGYMWLVDLDRLPRLSRVLRLLASFRAKDHVGDPGLSLRQNVDRFLDEHGLVADRVLMLTQARVLGYVFNPLTVYWCSVRDGEPVCTIAEVHNTYGGRHRYLMLPGETETAKAFYVSPFNTVSGVYRLDLPPPGEFLKLSVRLHQDGRPPFVATVLGRRRPATGTGLVRMFIRHPLAPLVTSLRIRRQGIGLYLRGLKIVPRD
ncbi:DUF1365 domain-containing protein [Actinomadura barringtoniae]|uniref:DUF1365 domain-containing protein n=1 Tax=Actinomadura barringtoniae TaxID=1427535 RepID=A0A939PE38_9ACTN|nr:DUF1365 domain-containing protein [Actinomadura barringtoniae]MBO2450920.1 DUF1365 domain-containing protein [Actinomadura barringtoniae]